MQNSAERNQTRIDGDDISPTDLQIQDSEKSPQRETGPRRTCVCRTGWSGVLDGTEKELAQPRTRWKSSCSRPQSQVPEASAAMLGQHGETRQNQVQSHHIPRLLIYSNSLTAKDIFSMVSDQLSFHGGKVRWGGGGVCMLILVPNFTRFKKLIQSGLDT